MAVRRTFLIALLSLLVVPRAQALTVSTLEFEDARGDSVSGYGYSTEGYGFTSNRIGFDAWTDDYGLMLVWGRDDDLTMERVDDSVFSLQSFGHRSVGGPGVMEVTGYYADGRSVSLVVSTSNDLLHLDLSPEWTGLTSVTFGGVGPGSFASSIDNVVVSAVPIPAAAWLFASGLGLLGWRRRKT